VFSRLPAGMKSHTRYEKIINKDQIMDALELLKKYKKRVDFSLEKYFDKKIQRAGNIDITAEEAVRMIKEYTMAGGKRIRPAVLYYSYLASGGKEEEKIIEASMSVELLHSFLLIHDDVIDRDATRHGVETMHEKFKNVARKYEVAKDINHFGNSMAMIAGDMTAAMACDIIFNGNFSSDVIVRALHKIQDIVFVTIPGEMLDVIMEYSGRATEEEVLKMYEGKTARYTFEGPMHLGCMLAGGSEENLKKFSDYALPLGIAFQIRDDIIGIFGQEKKIGKPVGSDVIEGKQTLLVVKALEIGNKGQKDIIKKYLGKKELNEAELDEFRMAVRESGALDYSQSMSEKLASDAREALSNIDLKNEEARIFFEGIIEYMVKREI
jgi:geranylgeranyl diphosphate synthase, type I